jgi:hypothetical protein
MTGGVEIKAPIEAETWELFIIWIALHYLF